MGAQVGFSNSNQHTVVVSIGNQGQGESQNGVWRAIANGVSRWLGWGTPQVHTSLLDRSCQALQFSVDKISLTEGFNAKTHHVITYTYQDGSQLHMMGRLGLDGVALSSQTMSLGSPWIAQLVNSSAQTLETQAGLSDLSASKMSQGVHVWGKQQHTPNGSVVKIEGKQGHRTYTLMTNPAKGSSLSITSEGNKTLEFAQESDRSAWQLKESGTLSMTIDCSEQKVSFLHGETENKQFHDLTDKFTKAWCGGLCLKVIRPFKQGALVWWVGYPEKKEGFEHGFLIELNNNQFKISAGSFKNNALIDGEIGAVLCKAKDETPSLRMGVVDSSAEWSTQISYDGKIQELTACRDGTTMCPKLFTQDSSRSPLSLASNKTSCYKALLKGFWDYSKQDAIDGDGGLPRVTVRHGWWTPKRQVQCLWVANGLTLCALIVSNLYWLGDFGLGNTESPLDCSNGTMESDNRSTDWRISLGSNSPFANWRVNQTITLSRPLVIPILSSDGDVGMLKLGDCIKGALRKICPN